MRDYTFTEKTPDLLSGDYVGTLFKSVFFFSFLNRSCINNVVFMSAFAHKRNTNIFGFFCTVTFGFIPSYVYDLHSGMDALYRLFPMSRDWKVELKKPSPDPLAVGKKRVVKRTSGRMS